MPVAEIVARLAIGPGEIGDFVLREACGPESFDRIFVHAGNGVVRGDNVGVVTRAAREEFPSQTRFVVDFEHVDAGVRNLGCDEGGDGLLPRSECLAGKAGDEVEAEVANAGGAKAGEVVEHDGSGVKAACVVRFAVDEGLDAKADAVDACSGEGGESGIGELARSAFDGDLGIGIHRESGTDGREELVDEIGFKEARGSAAEINCVDTLRQMGAQIFAPLMSLVHLSDQALDVPRVFTSGKHA